MASKARHLRRSSASSRRRSSMRVPTFSAWKKRSIRQRSSCQRSTVRAASRPARPSVVSSIRCSLPLSFFLVRRRGGFSSMAETAIMRTGGSPAGSVSSTCSRKSPSRSQTVTTRVSGQAREFLRPARPVHPADAVLPLRLAEVRVRLEHPERPAHGVHRHADMGRDAQGSLAAPAKPVEAGRLRKAVVVQRRRVLHGKH